MDIIVPALGESVSEATISKLHKKIGDVVKSGDIIVDLETDKITLEVPASSDGIITAITVMQGDVVKVGAKIGAMEDGIVVTHQSIPIVTANQDAVLSSDQHKQTIASPAASKIAIENSLDLETINGTGRGGRISKEDVLSAVGGFSPQMNVIGVSNSANVTITSCTRGSEERVKMTKLRKTIAERLKASQNTAAILTTFNEVDMSEIMRIRKAYQDKFQKKHGIKLGFMSFFAKAAMTALQEIPVVNAEISGDEIIYKRYYNIGIAVGTDTGLVVPVIKNIDELSFADIEKQIVDFGQKAKNGKLSISDMTGGTFSITNGGIYGSMLSTPIINPPQSAILGMHNIIERPVAIAGQVVIRPMMYIALSYDHRLIDGKEGVTFLSRIKEMIENPEKLLINL